jgi:hypothetical protein
MLVAEALLLLLLDDEKGSTSSGYARDEGLAGAVLLDLVALGLVDERDGVLVAVGAEPSSPVLARAWRAIGSTPRSIKQWVRKLPGQLKPIKRTVAEPLVARGVISEERHKILGLFPTTRYPEVDPGPESSLRSRLRAVLVSGAEPDASIAGLLALLVPLDLVKRVVERDERKAASARAKAVAERGPVGDAVRAAVQREVAAVVAATVAATTASTAATTGG